MCGGNPMRRVCLGTQNYRVNTFARSFKGKSILIALLIYGLAVIPVYSQAKGLKAVIFFQVDISNSDESAPYREVLYTALVKRLTEEGFDVVPRAVLEGNGAYAGLSKEERASGEKLLPIARDLGANTAVTGSYGIEGRRIYIQLKFYDVRTGKVVAAAMATGLAGLAGYNLMGSTVDNMAPAIQAYLAGYDPDEPILYAVVKDVVFLSSDEGMEVLYETGDPAGLIEQGRLTSPFVPFTAGTKVRVEKRKSGYYPDAEEIIMQEGPNEFTLRPLDKKYRNEISLYWTTGQTLGAGAGYRYYPGPDYFFLGTDAQLHLQYGFNSGDKPVVHDDISFSAGGYFFSSYDRIFRVGLSAGMGVIITSFTTPNMPVYTDYYLNYLSLFFDLNLRPWTIFFQVSGKYALEFGNFYLDRGLLVMDRLGPPASVGVRKKW
jgi:hypothetical protein